MVGVNVFAADTTEEAEFIATSFQQQFLSMIRNTPGQLPPPVKSMDGLWTEQEKYIVMSRLTTAIIGNPDQVKRQLQAFLDETQADEMIINSAIYDHKARLRSYEIVAEITGMKP